MRPQGVEDWEFFIHATLRGFRGGSGGAAGFYYRVRRASMLSGATKEFDTAKNALYARYGGILKPWNLVACEHRHLPRFRFIDEACAARDFSDPHLSSTFDQSCDPGYAPPITILGSGSAFERLRGAGMLRGILLAMHYQTRAHALPVGVELGRTGLRFERRGDVAKAPQLLAVQTRWLSATAQAHEERLGYTPVVDREPANGQPPKWKTDFIERGSGKPPGMERQDGHEH